MAELIPRPRHQQYAGGELAVDRLGGLLVTDPRLDSIAAAARGLLPARVRTARVTPAAGRPHIALILDAGDDPGVGSSEPLDASSSECAADEVYRIDVDADGILCRARTPKGVLRGLATVAQLADGTSTIAHQRIVDAPRFAWRGLMLDVARRFFPPREIREVIDLCALYKLNVLHLHLSDNEAWRLAIPDRPELTARGTSTAGPGHYTVAEFAQLQAYAADRAVTVVPEIDLPGHCAALRRAYPQLPAGARPAGLDPRIPFAAPLDLADPDTDRLVGELLAAVAAQTTGRRLHIGCDEAFGLDGDDFAKSVRRALSMVRELGKQPVSWQEAARAGVEPGEVVQHWVNAAMTDLPTDEAEFAIRTDLSSAGLTWPMVAKLRAFFAPSDGDVGRVLSGGGSVLLSPLSHLYLDRPYALAIAPPRQRALAQRLGFPNYHRHDLQTAVSWDPGGCGVPLEAVAGVEATLFTESVQSFADATALLLPRLPALAEAAWAPGPAAWPDLRERLATHAPLWRVRGWDYFASTEVAWL